MINKGKPVWVIVDEKGPSYDFEENVVGVFADKELVDKIVKERKLEVGQNEMKKKRCELCPFYNTEIPEKIFEGITTVPECHKRSKFIKPNYGTVWFGGYDYAICCRGNFESEDWLREYRVDEYKLNEEVYK